MSMRRNLVVVRAGDNSVHPGWLLGGERNFDLYVSYFGNDTNRYADRAEYHENRKGMKWPVIGELLARQPELQERYDYIWLPDDDLVADAVTISRMFDYARAFGLALAQPALTRDSYYTWPLLLQDTRYLLRFTRFIEVMAPVFDRAALTACLPTFTESASGWGLDSVWPQLLQGRGGDALAIIDAAAVRHSRPVGGGELYKATGTSVAIGDRDAIFEKYGLSTECLADARYFQGGVRCVRPGPLARFVQDIGHAVRRMNYRRLWRRTLARRRGSGA